MWLEMTVWSYLQRDEWAVLCCLVSLCRLETVVGGEVKVTKASGQPRNRRLVESAEQFIRPQHRRPALNHLTVS
jgi:hypothetical protein